MKLSTLSALLLATALCAWSQVGGGSIVGTITDPSGAPVAGVKVKAHNTLTNDEQQVSSNETGYYEFPLLRPGKYRMMAEASGFEKIQGAEFDLNTGTRARIDMQLKVGSVSETVEVSATAPVINTTTTDLGVVMDRTNVEELPLNGRDFQELISLQAGVENAPSSGAGDRGGVSFHGSSALAANMMMDGVDMSFGEVNGSAGFRSAGGGSVLINTVSVEALAEFKVTGSAFSAEYGRSGGGVLNITTRSGTNQTHGTLFEYFRNDALDANDYFSNQYGLAKPPLRWNQFGGNVGGPVRKDRIFYFFNYEGAKVKRVSKISGNTATPAMLAICPPAIRSMLDYYLPKSYTPTTNQYVGLHTRNDQQRNDEHTFLSRADGVWGAHRIGVRHSYNHQDYKSPSLSPVTPTTYPMRFNNAMVQDSWSVTSTSFNELRIGLNRVDLDRHPTSSDLVPAWITIGSISASQSSYIHFLSTTYTLADNFTTIRGKHSIKAGFELREVRSARGQGGLPTYAYNTYTDVPLEKPLTIQLLFGGVKGLRTRNHGFFIQDEWRVARRLQLNYGVRYEYTPPQRGGFNINSSDPYGPFISAQETMFRADRNDWAPRAGLVFVPDRAQRTAIRVGGAVSYLMPQQIQYYDMAFLDPALPFVASFSQADVPVSALKYPSALDFQTMVASNPKLLPSSFKLSRSIADYNRRDTYVGMWNVSVQEKISNLFSAQISYVGQRTVKLISVRPLNLQDPVTKVRPHPELGQVNYEENAANIAYHGMELSVNQRPWHGLSYNAFFTWAKSIGYYNPDDTITFTNNSLQDPDNIAGSKGRVRGLPTKRYTSTLSYKLPFGDKLKNRWARGAFSGWTLRTINSWRSGLPINITAGSDVVGNGRSAGQRADPVAGVDQYIREGLVWLNPAAFTNVAMKAQKRFGYLGFNAVEGTPALTLNSGLHKTFVVHENHRVNLRLETFNTLNHPLLGNPITNVADPNFGKIQSASGARNVQLALKYTF